MAPKNENNRRFRRRTVRILVDYQSDSGVRCDYATTLGAGGVFIESDDPLPSGSRVKLRFRLPAGEELHEIEARVAWVRGGPGGAPDLHAPGMGVQFTDSIGTAKLARELEDLQ
jgi:type IV pilus assembly protein PilZ